MTWRKGKIGTRKLFVTVIRATIVALIVVVTAVLVRDVLRDRNALEQAGPEANGQAQIGVVRTLASPENINTSEIVFRKASPSVVTVKLFGGEDGRLLTQGSGVVVGPGTVVTNRHVVEMGGEVRVVDKGQAFPASVLYADREYDLCALEAPGLSAPPVEMASVQTVRVGQRVYSIGGPRGLERSISDGLVSSIRAFGSFPVIQTNAPVSKGSSGGGLFDTDGRLVGITTFSAIEGQNINFALVSDLVPQLPSRSADIRTLQPVVPVRSADQITNKALLDGLQEGRQAIAVSEAELKAMEEELNRYTFALDEVQQSMNGLLAMRNHDGYNEMVPRYNDLVRLRSELATRYRQKRQAYVALVERQNRMTEQYNHQSRLK
jgi:S1-C subfamily serine protease